MMSWLWALILGWIQEKFSFWFFEHGVGLHTWKLPSSELKRQVTKRSARFNIREPANINILNSFFFFFPCIQNKMWARKFIIIFKILRKEGKFGSSIVHINPWCCVGAQSRRWCIDCDTTFKRWFVICIQK